jgi:putative ATP-dependent endonuclease of the OLD family
MAKIRKVEIKNFRSIQTLVWFPASGINCLIGPGDSGKSTVLDAIDLCLGARRTAQLGDTDFYGLDVSNPITIVLTLGALDDGLMSIENYGLFLRSFNGNTLEIEDEPEKEGEPVLTLKLCIEEDLEPVWTLVSDRAEAKEVIKSLAWKDRLRVAPTRLGTQSAFNLSWSNGSVLNRLSDEKALVALELRQAARTARMSFGDSADSQLSATLGIVTTTAKSLGVPTGDSARALLDANSVSFGSGAISLHNSEGIPLRNLGTGSSRLLIAGLQREAASTASIVLVDELEFGLEPHRLTRLLGSLGAKEKEPALQVFMTTHSPVALRELSGDQLYIIRCEGEEHSVERVGTDDDMQSALRSAPGVFLASSVIVCEGPSEMGLIRGLDDYRASKGAVALGANGVALFNAEGSTPDKCIEKACVLLRLGYRVMAFIDNDKPSTPATVDKLSKMGGKLVTWRQNFALEDEIFQSLSDESVNLLIARAQELTADGLVDQHIVTKSEGKVTLNIIETEYLLTGFSQESRVLLGRAARTNKAGWFKSISKMEGAARDIIGPSLNASQPHFKATLDELFAWAQTDD